MKKNVFGRRFKRNVNQRKALFKNLMSSLVLNEKIKTKEAKAKSIKSQVEKLVTKAKRRKSDARRFLSAHLVPEAIDKVIDRIAPQFSERPGGYTRIIRMGNRVSDSASMVVMEWVETIQNSKFKIQNSKKKKSKQVKASKISASKKIAVKNQLLDQHL